MEGFIQTVKGMIKKDCLGIVDSHSHLWIDKDDSSSKKESSGFRINNFSIIKRELNRFKNQKIRNISNGHTSIIDCQPGGCGRNGIKLLELFNQTGVNIIAVTGFHKKEYYPPDSPIWRKSKKDAENFFINEIKNNLKEVIVNNTVIHDSNNNEVKIKAGAIKIAFTGTLDGQYSLLTEAAISASLKTGAPIIVHTDRGLKVEKLIAFLEEKEIPLSKVMLCHMDKRADINLHKHLANKSIYLEYDTFNRPKYNPEKNVWPLLIEMIKEGYSDSIMIGSDPADNLSWESISKKGGLGGFFKNLTEKLFNSGIETTDIENIIKKNAQNFLCFN